MFQLQNILGVTINPATEDSLLAFATAQQLPSTQVLYNVALAVNDTEYSQALQILFNPTRRFEFQSRTAVDVRFAFVAGKVAGSVAPFMTLKAGRYYDSGQLYIPTGTAPILYLATSAAPAVIEMIVWF